MVRYLALCAVALVQLSWISLAAASFIDLPLHDLFSRDDFSCPANSSSCGSSYPSDFCCSTDTTCLGLDNYTSVLCCPTGSNCTFIVPITCNLQWQNATEYPTAPVKTTLLTSDLPTCGDGCCPFGYTCAKNNTCVLDVSTSSLSNSSSTSSALSATSSTSAAPTKTPTTIAISDSSPTTAAAAAAAAAATSGASVNSTKAATASTCQQYPGKAVAAGFFPGAIAGGLAAAIIGLCRRRSKRHEGETAAEKTHRSSRGAIIGISDPIPDEDNGSFRTDFLLRRKFSGRFPAPGTVTRPKSRIRRTTTRVKSIFIGGNNSHSASPQWNSASPPPVPSMPAAYEVPVTPPKQTGRLGPREPSTESIKVYSPPNILGADYARNTTFAEVIAQASGPDAKEVVVSRR